MIFPHNLLIQTSESDFDFDTTALTKYLKIFFIPLIAVVSYSIYLVGTGILVLPQLMPEPYRIPNYWSSFWIRGSVPQSNISHPLKLAFMVSHIFMRMYRGEMQL